MRPAILNCIGWLFNKYDGNKGNKMSAYDLSSATYTGSSYSPPQLNYVIGGTVFSSDGTKLYVMDTAGHVESDAPAIYQYTLSTPWDITTTSYASLSLNLSSVFSNKGSYGIALSS